MELVDGDQGDGDDQKRGSSAPTWKRRKRKTKTKKIKANVSNRFLFWHSRHYTIKREKLWLSGYQVPLGEVIIAYALGPSVLTINP
jgi:hypothetical protein